MNIRLFAQEDMEQICVIYQAAFAGAPWYEKLSMEIVLKRWSEYTQKSGFSCLVIEENGRVVGASWFDTPSNNELGRERGQALVEFVTKLAPFSRVVWIRDTIVDPNFQGRGIATLLKRSVIEKICKCFRPAVLLTRMRDDNKNIIHINEQLGFQRTGIRVQSSQKKNVYHEYWFLVK